MTEEESVSSSYIYILAPDLILLGYEQHAFSKMLAFLLLLSGSRIFLGSQSNYFYV